MSGKRQSAARLVDRVWYADDRLARGARVVLAPLGALYGLVVAARGRLYERGVLRVHDTELPALSVGNLSVGGTGKTPVSAWLAGELAARGARPAIVLRGYGADEPLVHAILNPAIPVVTNADRVVGIREARARGAGVVVLDDAFQHRRARRVADVVLLSADRWAPGHGSLLPAGPWREPLSALRRASLVLVTRKAASTGRAAEVVDAVRRAAPDVPVGVVRLAPGELHPAPGGATGESHPLPLRDLAGAAVFAISAIGDARAFHEQLVECGARLSPPPAAFPDHHPFDAADAARLARDGAASERVVCTLKDAVKLAPLWPRAGPPLWYVSQRVTPEAGADAVDKVLGTVLDARAARRHAANSDTTGSGRLTATDHGHRPPPADR